MDEEFDDNRKNREITDEEYNSYIPKDRLDKIYFDLECNRIKFKDLSWEDQKLVLESVYEAFNKINDKLSELRKTRL